ncbi:MAG: tryptophan--tRNA ligase [Candidatus Aenigmatarchaeota archaeon]
MNIAFSERLRERFPTIFTVSATITGVDNTGSRALRSERREIESIIKKQYRKFWMMKNVNAYEKYFTRHGIEFPLATMYRAVLEGKEIPTLSPLVDAILLAELKHCLLLDIKDLDRIEGGLVLDEGYEGEEFIDMHGEKQFIQQGDIVLRDDKGIILSWLYGPAQRTKVHRDTRNAIIIGLPVPGIEEKALETCIKDAVKYVMAACKGKVEGIEFHRQKEAVTEKQIVVERLDPWGKGDIKDYGRLQEEFGIQDIKPLVSQLKPHPYFSRGIIFGHRDLDVILKAINAKKPWVLMTGLMPSGPFHFGHKMIIDEVIYWQAQGVEVYLCMADLEAYAVRKMAMEDIKKIAIDEYLLNAIALGLKPEKCHFYLQSEWKPAYYRLVSMLSRKVTFNEFKDIYGDISPAKIQAALLQAADILHPQLKEFGGPKPVLVPVGVDQDPHLRLTRDLADRFKELGFIRPSSTYHIFMKGLKGGKMSSSDPASHIALSENPKAARRKIMSALTGGGGSVKEQREKGGKPEICTIFDMFRYHLADDKQLHRIYDECKKGKRICGDCKRECADALEAFLIEHQKRLEKAKRDVKKFIEK